MRRRTLISTAAALPAAAALATAPQDPVWRSSTPLPIRTQELYPAVHGGELIVAGGIAARLGVPYFTGRCFAFDPLSARWRDLPELPEARHHVALTSCAGALFAIGGFHGSIGSVWQMRDTVLQLAGDGWQPIGRLPQPQAEGVLASRDGVVHLVTGQTPRALANADRSDHHEIANHWRWQFGSPRWEPAAPIPTPRNSATGGWVGGLLVVTGGRTARGNLDVTEIYDPAEDRWHQAAPLPLPQAGTASVAVAGGLIVFGGEIFNPQPAVFANVWHYSLSRDAWTALPDMPTPRHGLGAGRIGDDIMVIGGATRPGGSGTSDANEILVYKDTP